MTIGDIKKKFHDHGVIEDCPIRTFLVTARSAASSGLRALRVSCETGVAFVLTERTFFSFLLSVLTNRHIWICGLTVLSCEFTKEKQLSLEKKVSFSQ